MRYKNNHNSPCLRKHCKLTQMNGVQCTGGGGNKLREKTTSRVPEEADRLWKLPKSHLLSCTFNCEAAVSALLPHTFERGKKAMVIFLSTKRLTSLSENPLLFWSQPRSILFSCPWAHCQRQTGRGCAGKRRPEDDWGFSPFPERNGRRKHSLL